MPGHANSLPPRQPRRSSPSPSSTPSRPVRRKSAKRSGPPVAAIVGGVAAVIVLIVGGVVAFQKFGSAAGIRVSASDLGLGGVVGDSPKAVLGDFLDVLDDLLTTVKAVQDAETAQAAVAKLEGLENQLLELQRRAVLVEPIPQAEQRAIEDSLGKPESATEFKSEAERLKGAGLVEGEFASAMRSLGFQMRSTLNVLKDGMTELPEPKNEFETLARDYVELEREQGRIIARVKTVADIPAAVSELKALVPQIEALVERKRAFGRTRQSLMSVADNRYTFRANSGAANHLRTALTIKLGHVPELEDAISAVATAESQYTFALMGGPVGGLAADPHTVAGAGGPAAGRPGGTAAGVRPAGPAETAGTSPQPRGVAAPGQSGMARPFVPRTPVARPGGEPPTLRSADRVTVVLKGGPFTLPAGLKGKEYIDAARRRFEIVNEYGGRLKTLADSNHRHSSLRNNESHNSLTYSGDIQELADKIDFGTVTEVNAATRTITVEMPDIVETPEVKEPAAPKASSTGGFDV